MGAPPYQHAGLQKLLPESQWRYFVIAFHGPNTTVDKIQAASDIAPVELEILFTVVKGGLVWQQDHVFQILQQIRQNDDFFVEISASDVAEIKMLRARLEQSQSQVLDVSPFLRQLTGLIKGPSL